jgi:hypothetical protein
MWLCREKLILLVRPCGGMHCSWGAAQCEAGVVGEEKARGAEGVEEKDRAALVATAAGG